MSVKDIMVPEMGEYSHIPIIEIYIKAGDKVSKEDPLLSLESAKAVTDIPSPHSGTILEVIVNEGDEVSTGDILMKIETEEEKAEKAAPEETAKKQDIITAGPEYNRQAPGAVYHATPSTRQYAREQEILLSQLKGTGPNGRILKSDVDMAKGGELPERQSRRASSEKEERLPLTRIQKIAGPRLTASINTIPHVTQFNQADITELTDFRKTLDKKVSLLPFIIKAVTTALKSYPVFNSVLDESSSEIILKKYYNIGIAVDTREGLLVPVIKDADRKNIYQLGEEIKDLADKSRTGTAGMGELSGATFSISSLGGIGGTGFTPIINPPEAAILGVSRAGIQPVWNGSKFVPRELLPLSLSYDHRIIDGAAGARFIVYLSELLQDIRRILL